MPVATYLKDPSEASSQLALERITWWKQLWKLRKVTGYGRLQADESADP